MSRTLIVFTAGGLGNRMRALLGALTLAKMQGRDFSYVWKTSEEFSAPLTDLWEFPYPRVPGIFDRIGRRIGLHQRLGLKFYDDTLSDLDAIKADRRVRIDTIHAMKHPLLNAGWRDEFRALRPVAEIQRRVRETRSKGIDTVPYVALMIRAHSLSHGVTLQHSPLEWYFSHMERISGQFPGIPFFLSTDSPEAQEAVQKRFDNVVVQENKGGYNSLIGLQAAVADLYLLASASFVLQPYYSSFPDMARMLADPRVRFVHAKSEEQLAEARFDLSPPVDPLRPSVRN